MVARVYQSEPSLKFITPSKFVRATPTLAVWGIATASMLALFGSDLPIARQDILSKIPLVGQYFPVLNPKKTEEEE